MPLWRRRSTRPLPKAAAGDRPCWPSWVVRRPAVADTRGRAYLLGTRTRARRAWTIVQKWASTRAPVTTTRALAISMMFPAIEGLRLPAAVLVPRVSWRRRMTIQWPARLRRVVDRAHGGRDAPVPTRDSRFSLHFGRGWVESVSLPPGAPAEARPCAQGPDNSASVMSATGQLSAAFGKAACRR